MEHSYAYACAFNGQCEFDLDGQGYQSEVECQSECIGRENKGIQYEIYTYAPEEALYLAPVTAWK